MKTLEDALYDLNDAVQSLIEGYDTSALGEEFETLLRNTERNVTKMCIISDVVNL